MILVDEILIKFLHQQLIDLLTSSVRCRHFTLGNPKSHHLAVLYVHDSHYLSYLRTKLTAVVRVT